MDHALNTLSGFFRFLNNQTNRPKTKKEIPPQPVNLDIWFSRIDTNPGAKPNFPAACGHTNVLLLALSTFGRSLRSTNYLYDFEGIAGKVEGYYQLEPIPKMLEKLLADKKEYLDKVIMLCTRETLATTTVRTPQNKQLTVSPVEYFQRAIRKYLNPHQKDEDCFVTINVSLDSPYDGIQRVIETLRGIENPKLYLDTHGGIRGIQRILEATVSLLKIEHINVEAAYAVEFGSNSQTSRIISETENMKIYDFVAGVNEFITCGRADTLKKYSDDSRQSSTSQEQELIHAIQTVANGIQWCCVPEFENGLKDLQSFFQKNSNTKTENDLFSYLDIYKKDIELDYQELVREHNVADEINWCLKKHFYQQAITLIEAKIPILLIEKWKILKINTDKYPRCPGLPETYKLKHPDAPATSSEFFNALVFATNKKILNLQEDVPTSNNNDHYKNQFLLTRKKFKELEDEGYENFLETIRQNNHSFAIDSDSINNYIVVISNTATIKRDKKIKVPNCINTSDIDATKRPLLFQLLILHRTLKDVRNTMNHAKDKQIYTIGSIIQGLEYYMKLVDQLNPNK